MTSSPDWETMEMPEVAKPGAAARQGDRHD
jgi:hypothetical protein